MFCEEAAYMDLSVFYEVVVPLWEMGEAVMIMISTPVDSFNFYSVLLDMRDPDTGARIFLVFEAELICKRCAGKKNEEECKHNLHWLPDWKSAEKLDVVKKIMKDNIAILKRESMYVDNKMMIIHVQGCGDGWRRVADRDRVHPPVLERQRVGTVRI
jgi:hypothetical protein